MRFAILMAILIAVLLWRTRWPTLWPGLTILLVAQAGAALILLYRNTQISNNLRRLSNNNIKESMSLTWFDTEEVFLKRLALFENGVRMIGFVVLAYGFWIPTQSLWIALALGIVYPVIAFFGLGRRNNTRIINSLKAQKNEIQALLAS